MTATSAFQDILIARLHAAGVRRLFGVPGGGTSLDLMVAAKAAGIEVIITAREDAAVIMAGVSGVLAETPGVAFATRGPGLASAINGVAAATLDRFPALLVAEIAAPAEYAYVSHQFIDQAAMVRPLMRQEGDLLAAHPNSLDAWLQQQPSPPRRPATLFPTVRDFSQSFANTPEPALKQAVKPDNSVINQAALQIADAERPVFIIGLEAARAGLVAPIRDVITRSGGGALTTYMAAGTIAADDPHQIGLFTGGALERPAVASADLIVLVGLDPVELIPQPWAYSAPVIDLAEEAHQPHYLTPDLQIIAALPETLSALLAALPSDAADKGWSTDDLLAHQSRMRAALEGGGGDGLTPSAAVAIAADSFAGKPRLAVDAGAHMFTACAFWPSKAPRDLLISNGLATMGFAIPAAIAAALHDPVRGALAITGDGGALMCLGELKTIAQYQANVCILLFNDGRLSLIDIKREARQMADLGLSWEAPDFAMMAAGFGFQTWTADSTDSLHNACQQAAANSGPRLIDARIVADSYLEQIKALRG
jgi:acetolactate synthase-1/2/3 large subunit